MLKSRLIPLAALVAALSSAPVLAQGSTAMLRVDIGSAMVSTGGEFTSATSGSQLAPGSRVMLTEGSQATLVYPNGCTQPLTTAGVHSVPATCVAAAGPGGSSAGAPAADLGGAAIISGVAVVGAAALEAMDDEPYVEPPPVSR